MQNLITLILIVCSPLLSWTQIQFYKLYSNNGYDFGQGIVQLEDSSYLITGSSSSFSDDHASQAFLMNIDSLGNFKWSQNYGGTESDWGRRVLAVKNYAYYVSGYTNSIGHGGYDFFLVKTDLNGNLLWEKAYGESGWEKVNDAVILADTSILMVGQTNSNTFGDNDIYLVKTDKEGDTLWTKQIQNEGEDFATSIKILNDSICYVGGQIFNSDSTLNKGFLMRLKTNGTIEWIKQYGQHGHYIVNDLCITPNRINIIGNKTDTLTGLVDAFLGKIYLSGGISYIFDNSFPGYDSHELISTFQNPNSLYIATNIINEGTTYPEGKDLTFSRYTEPLLWDNHGVNVSNTGDDIGGQIIGTSDGGVIMVGYNTHFGFGGNNVFAIKIGADEVFPNTSENPTVTNLVSVNEINTNTVFFHYYPNPTSTILTIEYDEEISGKLLILDLLGNALSEFKLDHQIQLNNFDSGQYILKLILNNGTERIYKLTITH
ncbi:MAG: T9SS type A sorting domain-containing protein [Flavobacteriia bacterium]|nr:T9SS type A sorting domain-containing protein [Flavobacteriia bacterium]